MFVFLLSGFLIGITLLLVRVSVMGKGKSDRHYTLMEIAQRKKK